VLRRRAGDGGRGTRKGTPGAACAIARVWIGVVEVAVVESSLLSRADVHPLPFGKKGRQNGVASGQPDEFVADVAVFV
jgi:hypothetical protein